MDKEMSDRELWMRVFETCMMHEPHNEVTFWVGGNKVAKATWAMDKADSAVSMAPKGESR